MADPVQHLIQLTKSFNAFVQQCGRDFAGLRQTLGQVVAGHNQLDKALEQLAHRQAAMEQGWRQLAGIVSNGGAGAVPSIAQPIASPAGQTVDGQAVPVAVPAAPAVSASGAPMSDLSEEDAKIMFSGGED